MGDERLTHLADCTHLLLTLNSESECLNVVAVDTCSSSLNGKMEAVPGNRLVIVVNLLYLSLPLRPLFIYLSSIYLISVSGLIPVSSLATSFLLILMLDSNERSGPHPNLLASAYPAPAIVGIWGVSQKTGFDLSLPISLFPFSYLLDPLSSSTSLSNQ